MWPVLNAREERLHHWRLRNNGGGRGEGSKGDGMIIMRG